jgi:hypothetical protein
VSPGATVADLERFYWLIDRLSRDTGGPHVLRDFSPSNIFPTSGVYFCFEPSERRAASENLRVVRVGTHRDRAGSQSTLWSRLHAHRGNKDGSGGSRGGSIYRAHIGWSILARDGGPDQASVAPRATRREWITAWASLLTATSSETSDKLYERAISSSMSGISFTCVAVLDPSSKRSDRAYIERNAIALLSTVGRRVDPPSSDWLGLKSPHPEVRTSGLWNVDHVGRQVDPRFLEILETYVDATCGPRTPPTCSIAPISWR